MSGLKRPGSAVCLVAFILLTAGMSNPETSCSFVGGALTEDTFWQLANSPYCVNEDITVSTGATLTISPGVSVLFATSKYIQVDGTLVARGTAGSPIIFTSLSGSPDKGDWGYIHFTDTSSDAEFDSEGNYQRGSIIQYGVIQYAGGLVIAQDAALRVESSSPYIDHSAILHNGDPGIYVINSASPRITNNLIADNGIASTSGIIVLNSSNTLLSGNIIRDNAGRGIFVVGGSATIINNFVRDNSYGGGGDSGIKVEGSLAAIVRNTISGNSSSGFSKHGGGIGISGGIVAVRGNIISSNTGEFGGGIGVEAGTAVIRDNAINNNSATASAGGIYLSRGSKASILGNIINGNSARAAGGGIYVYNSTASIVSNLISANSASTGSPIYGGGGISVSIFSAASIGGNIIGGNTAYSGGGIYVSDDSSATINGNVVRGNAALIGGGIHLDIDSLSNIWGNSIIENTASDANQGGGIAICRGCSPAINYNNLFGNSTGSPAALNDIYNDNLAGSVVDATSNYWGTTNSLVIAAHIWDFSDNSSLGTVNYIPYLTTPILVMDMPDIDMAEPPALDSQMFPFIVD